MADYTIPLVNLVSYQTPYAIVGGPAATLLSDGSDASYAELFWEYGNTAKQNFVRGYLDGSMLPADMISADVSSMSWRVRYSHDYPDPVPAYTALNVLDSTSGWPTLSPSLGAGVGFSEVVFAVNSNQRYHLSVPTLRTGVRQIQLHRQNSMGDGLPIRVSEVALLVTATVGTGGKPSIGAAFQDGRRRFT